jgi:transposase-like protein
MVTFKNHVESGSNVYTDGWPAYGKMDSQYVHQVIDHAEKYVDGLISTNGCENFWSLLKRMLKGTYVSVEPFHLFRYLDEQSLRYNTRKGTDGDRFKRVTEQVTGKRLTYKELTGKEKGEAEQAH